jgi:hypothetical protein
LFLLFEDGNVALLENVVALVRQSGGTRVILSGECERKSGFTPLAIDRRSKNFGGRTGGMKIKKLNGGNLRDG